MMRYDLDSVRINIKSNTSMIVKKSSDLIHECLYSVYSDNAPFPDCRPPDDPVLTERDQMTVAVSDHCEV